MTSKHTKTLRKTSSSRYSPPKTRIFYTIVVPAYKEEEVIGPSLKTLNTYLQKQGFHHKTEVIVVAAEGGDKTAEIARKQAKHFTHFQLIEPGARAGKGRDVRLGMISATGKYVIFTDADLATPVEHINEAFARLERGADIVIGTRNLRKIHKGYRAGVSVLANVATRLSVLPGVSDTQCGFKGFKQEVAHHLFSIQRIEGWGFDIEILAIAKRFGYSIEEIGIHNWRDPKLEQHLVGDSPLKAVSSTLMELAKIRFNLSRGVYKKTTKFGRQGPTE